LRYTKWLNLRQLTGQSGRETGCGFEDFGLKMTQSGSRAADFAVTHNTGFL
jgi:hypothetical protein